MGTSGAHVGYLRAHAHTGLRFGDPEPETLNPKASSTVALARTHARNTTRLSLDAFARICVGVRVER